MPTREFLDGIDDQANIKSFQRRWFDTVSKSVDAYMRSPAFLQAMKQNTDAAVKLKRQADDLASEIARNANIPTAGDISGLFERLHSIEEVILGGSAVSTSGSKRLRKKLEAANWPN